MTLEQEQHLARIKGALNAAVDAKYRAGQREHGGNLFDLSIAGLLSAAIDEAIDQAVYLLTLRDILSPNPPAPKLACLDMFSGLVCTLESGHLGRHEARDRSGILLSSWAGRGHGRLSDAVPPLPTPPIPSSIEPVVQSAMRDPAVLFNCECVKAQRGGPIVADRRECYDVHTDISWSDHTAWVNCPECGGSGRRIRR